MDQIVVDVGDDPVTVGDEVVLLGAQGGEEVTADEWAEKTGTISYEIVCGIGPRLPRRFPSPTWWPSRPAGRRLGRGRPRSSSPG